MTVEMWTIIGAILGFVLVHTSFAVAYSRPIQPRRRTTPSGPGVMLHPWQLDPFLITALDVRDDR